MTTAVHQNIWDAPASTMPRSTSARDGVGIWCSSNRVVDSARTPTIPTPSTQQSFTTTSHEFSCGLRSMPVVVNPASPIQIIGVMR